MGLRRKLRVEPGTRPCLADIDTGFHGDFKSEKTAGKQLAKNAERLGDLQQKLYGEGRHALLIVLQGMDAAGKDGTCWHVMSAMNPQGTVVKSFKQPTAEELRHDFLWRIHAHTPGLGEVAVFNRSHYEDVLVVRVHDLVPEAVWSGRYRMINDFEAMLAAQGTTILKFFLHISPAEQLRRFEQRLADPARQWKISESDYSERPHWDAYQTAYEDALEKCSTEHAPWYVIPSDRKWFRNLAISHIIAKTLDGLDMKLPAPSVDIEKIRALYHSASGTPTADQE